MNEPKHTPGPWQATWVPAEKAWAVEQSNRGPFVALLNTEPDARLIAAAPELLEACIAALPHHQGGHSRVGKLLAAAIAKATGKEAWE